jgi:hypothetical protein
MSDNWILFMVSAIAFRKPAIYKPKSSLELPSLHQKCNFHAPIKRFHVHSVYR